MTGCFLHPGGGFGCRNCDQVYQNTLKQEKKKEKERSDREARIADLERRVKKLEKLLEDRS